MAVRTVPLLVLGLIRRWVELSLSKQRIPWVTVMMLGSNQSERSELFAPFWMDALFSVFMNVNVDVCGPSGTAREAC